MTTFRQTIPKHELSGPAKVQNDAKERRKGKEEGAEGKRQTFVFILATFEISKLRVDIQFHILSTNRFHVSDENDRVSSLQTRLTFGCN